MTLFDFREFVESMIPAWVPFVVAAIGIVGIVFIFPTLLFILISQIRATSAASAGKDFQYPLVLFRLIKA